MAGGAVWVLTGGLMNSSQDGRGPRGAVTSVRRMMGLQRLSKARSRLTFFFFDIWVVFTFLSVMSNAAMSIHIHEQVFQTAFFGPLLLEGVGG